MSGQIRMTPDTMRERANQYRTQADAVNNVISQMDNLLSMLQGSGKVAQASPTQPVIRS